STCVFYTLSLHDALPIFLEYLEEAYPSPALLPADAIARARVRAMGQMIACDIHPLNNLRVLRYLKHQLGVNDDARTQWYRHWVEDRKSTRLNSSHVSISY